MASRNVSQNELHSVGSLPLNTFISNFGNFTLFEFDVEAVLNLEIPGKIETVGDFFLVIN